MPQLASFFLFDNLQLVFAIVGIFIVYSVLMVPFVGIHETPSGCLVWTIWRPYDVIMGKIVFYYLLSCKYHITIRLFFLYYLNVSLGLCIRLYNQIDDSGMSILFIVSFFSLYLLLFYYLTCCDLYKIPSLYLIIWFYSCILFGNLLINDISHVNLSLINVSINFNCYLLFLEMDIYTLHFCISDAFVHIHLPKIKYLLKCFTEYYPGGGPSGGPPGGGPLFAPISEDDDAWKKYDKYLLRHKEGNSGFDLVRIRPHVPLAGEGPTKDPSIGIDVEHRKRLDSVAMSS